jgi:hypothetical protein
MNKRENTIRQLGIGDIFHGRSSNGAGLICLVTELDDDTIYARRITSQDDVQFDRSTGLKKWGGQGTIDCVTPFPPEIHSVLVELDRKYQKFDDMRRKGVEPDASLYKLTPAEVQAFLSIDDHVLANPI